MSHCRVDICTRLVLRKEDAGGATRTKARPSTMHCAIHMFYSCTASSHITISSEVLLLVVVLQAYQELVGCYPVRSKKIL